MVCCLFMSDLAYTIGVDLGGTNLRAAAIDRAGNILDKTSGATNFEEGRDAVLNDIAGAVNQLRARFGSSGFYGIGIGVPGFIDIERGVIVGTHNLLGFDGFPMRDDLSQRLSTPVILENDANAAALGEKWMGAGRDVNDLVLLTLGTGIGGGIISGGRVLHGHVGMAGELGHITAIPGGNPCGCGNSGCLEKHASATAVEAMAKLVALGDHLTAKDVFDLAEQGNPLALMVFHHMGTALGLALATLINIFNFPLYLLSGGVLPAWKFFAPVMLAEIEKRSFTYRHTKTRVEPATLGNQAGLYGAAYLPFLMHKLSAGA
ncbi:MAG: ROK family protein [Bryobacterales bacterium]|nr:ROK family protein [Bryobacterales bacterium]